MKFGFVVPWADAADMGELAVVAEAHGWDGIFMWEPVWGVDPWSSLAVAATRTTRIHLGTMLTPLPRRKPWELASQVATVDRLSKGRVILSVGLGAPESGYPEFGEIVDRRVRAELMDDGLAILRGLWAGQPFRYHGTHHRIEPCAFPAIGNTYRPEGVPIWCVGAIGAGRSMQRARSCDGLIPQAMGDGGARAATLDDLRALTARPDGIPRDRPYDVVVEGSGSEHSPAAWAAAGATWWIESLWAAMNESQPVDAAFDLLRGGPPSPLRSTE